MLTLSDAIRAVKDAEGNVTEACRLLGCSRETFYVKRRKYQRLADAVDEARTVRREWRKDMARGKLDEALEKGQPWAVRMVLTADSEFAQQTRTEQSGDVTIRVRYDDDD